MKNISRILSIIKLNKLFHIYIKIGIKNIKTINKMKENKKIKVSWQKQWYANFFLTIL